VLEKHRKIGDSDIGRSFYEPYDIWEYSNYSAFYLSTAMFQLLKIYKHAKKIFYKKEEIEKYAQTSKNHLTEILRSEIEKQIDFYEKRLINGKNIDNERKKFYEKGIKQIAEELQKLDEYLKNKDKSAKNILMIILLMVF